MDIKKYFFDFNEVLSCFLGNSKNKDALNRAVAIIKGTRKGKRKIILIGNGGSAAIAEHMAIDLSKNACLKAMTISGAPQLTAIANDYGYEYIFSKGVEIYAEKGDVLIAISSGGRSKNILNAVKSARKKMCAVITFSGFDPENTLRKKGDVNLYVDSRAYGYVEIIHNLLLHYINDKIIGSAVYKAC